MAECGHLGTHGAGNTHGASASCSQLASCLPAALCGAPKVAHGLLVVAHACQDEHTCAGEHDLIQQQWTVRIRLRITPGGPLLLPKLLGWWRCCGPYCLCYKPALHCLPMTRPHSQLELTILRDCTAWMVRLVRREVDQQSNHAVGGVGRAEALNHPIPFHAPGGSGATGGTHELCNVPDWRVHTFCARRLCSVQCV